MNIEEIAAQVAQTIQKEANIDAIFGEPRKIDEHCIIPVARVSITLGAGRAGTSKAKNGANDSAGSVLGGGTSGGMEIEVQPLGFVRDTASGAEFVAIDPTPEGLLGKFEHLIKGIRAGQSREDKDKQPASVGHAQPVEDAQG